MNKMNQKGFISHLLTVFVSLVVIAVISGAYFYVKSQNKDSAKKDQQITAITAQLETLKKAGSIPEDWKVFNLSDSKVAVLPGSYSLDKAMNGTFLYSSQEDQVKISVHQYSLPSINYITNQYDKYCQFASDAWAPFSNIDNVQTVDNSEDAISACKKVVSTVKDNVIYYIFEDTTGYNYHLAYAVKVGDIFYVLNYENYFNNYGSEAIQAMATDLNKTMLKTAQKIVLANK